LTVVSRQSAQRSSDASAVTTGNGAKPTKNGSKSDVMRMRLLIDR
jgi:hypothetical protein